MASSYAFRSSQRSDRHFPLPSSSSSSSSSVRSIGNVQLSQSSVRSSKVPNSRRSVTPSSRSNSNDNDEDPGRVRVAIRLRPKNAEDLQSDADFADCVELQPELKRLKLRKNNWSSELFRFDEVFTENASQRRVYEVVAKPVVESVLNGYNGTIMAYGQTGTGKTYTVGRLGKEDASERGIMIRALEDVIANTSSTSDCLEVSYLQLYMESIQDLLSPEKVNIPIVEDPKTGEVSLPGVAIIRIRDLNHFLELLQIGEANRHAANTKLNTESSRSHAILMVYVRRSVSDKVGDEASSQESNSRIALPIGNRIPTVRKSKLLIVDLAGSERIDKSGSEGHLLEEAKFINLSLTSLGKCINALAENSPHIPVRDSKLTRLLRDSFGGSARTSLIITIGPSARYHAETTSTIMFGQRAMKIVNMVKLKEEFDYESLCRKLENQVDFLTAEIERQQKLRDYDRDELEKKLIECEISFAEAEKSLLTRSEVLEKENTRLELEIKDILDELNQLKDENKVMCDEVSRLELSLKHEKVLEKENSRLELEMKDILDELNQLKDQNNVMCDEVARLELSLKHGKQHQFENSTYQKVLADTTQMYEKKISELIKELEDEHTLSESAEEQVDVMKKHLSDHQKSIQQYQMEISTYQKALADTTQMYEKKVAELTKQLEDEDARFEGAENSAKKLLNDCQNSMQKEIDELAVRLEEMTNLHESTVNELQSSRLEYKDLLSEKEILDQEFHAVRQRLLAEEKQRKTIENELVELRKNVPDGDDDFEDKRPYLKESLGKGSAVFGAAMGLHKSNQSRETLSGQRATIAKICEEVGLQKILALLASEDPDVQIHAVKVVANLAAEDVNQEKIVEEGGLDALLMLLQSSQNTTVLRVASGAIANLAMNEMNQGLIMSKGGGQLLARTACKTDDPQTLRMVAGAVANLCGNENLHTMLKEDGGIKALLVMVRSGNSDVIAQVARGLANFAKCESRAILQGHKKGRSLLTEDGALSWLIANSNIRSASTRRHVELALCHLAQNEDNTRDFTSSGGFKELLRISTESTRDDIRNLAKKILQSNPTFQAETYV